MTKILFGASILGVILVAIATVVYMGDRNDTRPSSGSVPIEGASSTTQVRDTGRQSSRDDENASNQELRRWTTVSQNPSADQLTIFLEEYPNGEYSELAKALLLQIAIRSACDEYLKANSEATLDAEHFFGHVVRALSSEPETVEQYRMILEVLAIAMQRPPAEHFRLSILQITPDSGDSLRLGADAMSTGISMTGNVTSGAMRLDLQGMIIPPDGSLSGAIALGRGQYAFGEPDQHRRNFSGNIAIEGINGQLVAFTELPDEWVFYKTGGFGANAGKNAGIVIPNGRGTILRFRGEVKEFFPGFTINGDNEYPLAFILLDTPGLTYLCGHGTVVGPTGQKYEFPPGSWLAAKADEEAAP